MTTRMKTRTILTAIVVAGTVGFAANSFAAVSGQCANCHTMHNSQNGVAFTGPDVVNTGSDGPNGSLLRWDCLGCHTGSNDTGKTTPYVMASADPSSNYTNAARADSGLTNVTLAGGNFWWVENAPDDTKGHNLGVAGVTNQDDDNLNAPPGFAGGFGAEGGTSDQVAGGTWPDNQSVTCAGLYGCHGNHDTDDQMRALRGAHHNGTSLGGNYRFLKGIGGLEDSDWERGVDTNNHNVYKGLDRTTDTAPGTNTGTISYLCAECHGKFHSGAGTAEGIDAGNTTFGSTNAWIRHPTDFDMTEATGTEYAAYGGGTTFDGSYNVIAPVAATQGSIDGGMTTANFTTIGADKAVVTCISCHRAHGTPYSDLLRWDYTNQCDAGNTGKTDADCGCFACHTQKND